MIRSRKTFLGLKSGKFRELEDDILEYVKGASNNGVGVSQNVVCQNMQDSTEIGHHPFTI
jgi:hypothetical protein